MPRPPRCPLTPPLPEHRMPSQFPAWAAQAFICMERSVCPAGRVVGRDAQALVHARPLVQDPQGASPKSSISLAGPGQS